MDAHVNGQVSRVGLSNITLNNFLVLGRAGMDLYAEPSGTAIEYAKSFFPALGGSAANISSAITRLSGSASLLTSVSDDSVGRYVLGQLKLYNVATDFVYTASGQVRTSLAVVETKAENCQSVLYRNCASDFELSVKHVQYINMSKFGALIVTGTALAKEPSREATFATVSKAINSNIPVIFDVDYRGYSWDSLNEAASVCNRLAELSDIVVGNDEEFDVLSGSMSGINHARRLSQSEDRIIVYKMGPKGSTTFYKSEEFFTGTYPVSPLKPTGAGDSFMGGFVTGLAQGLSIRDSVNRGSAAAALVVTRVGCSPANPTTDELLNFMANNAPKR